MTKTSPSQLATHLECPRKRWLGSFLKVPDKSDHGKRDIGTAYHGCAERWLLADDQGRVPDPVPEALKGQTPGNPVDPFPDGWDVIEGRPLSWRDAVVVSRLFRESVDSGVLRRLPGREVEVWRNQELVAPSEMFPEGIITRMKMDQRNPDVVEDHKTTGSKRFALGSAKLRADPKMMAYAVQHFADFPEAETVILRLNYNWTGKGRKPPWTVEVPVTRAEAETFRAEVLLPAVKEMAQNERIPEAEWRLVEGPREEGACEKYGGCPYVRLCSGLSTVADLRRVPAAGKVDLDKFAAIAAAKPFTLEEPPPSPMTDLKTPPWHVSTCRACVKTPGIDGKGRPCRACDLVSSRTGGKSSNQFKVWVDKASGQLMWAEPDGKAAIEARQDAAVAEAARPDAVIEPPRALTPLKPLKKTEKPKAEPKAAEPEPAPPAPEPAPEPAPLDVVEHKPVIEDRRKPPLILLLGATARGAREMTDLLNQLGEEMAKVGGVESYYDLDPFRRRDQFAKQAKTIVEQITTDAKPAVFQAGTERSPDLDALIVAMIPHATMVIRGVAR